MAERRKDSKNRVLRAGESQRKDGTYMYRYTDVTGKRVCVYARTLEDLREMDFGTFEGRNYVEMENDPDYRAWVASNCESACPDGERKDDFCDRSCAVFAKLVDGALAAGRRQLVILAHGGTQMSVMERFALPRKEYHDWLGPNAGGYLLETDPETWAKDHTMRCLAKVQYTKDAMAKREAGC